MSLGLFSDVHSAVFILCVLLAGAVTGSLLTAVIERLPQRRSALWGRSRCPRCGQVVAPKDLVPVVSFLLLRGRCRTCRSNIPRWHLAVELGMIGLFVFAAVLHDDASLLALGSLLVLLALLLALAVIDLQHFLLPDSLVAGLAVVGLLRSLSTGVPGAQQSLLAGAAGLLALGALAYIPWSSGIRHPASGIQSAMGRGDVKLAGAMGLTLGLPQLLFALFLAFVFGGLLGAVLVATRRASLTTRIPFGPFLAGATAVTLIIPELSDRFFSLLGVY